MLCLTEKALPSQTKLAGNSLLLLPIDVVRWAACLGGQGLQAVGRQGAGTAGGRFTARGVQACAGPSGAPLGRALFTSLVVLIQMNSRLNCVGQVGVD